MKVDPHFVLRVRRWPDQPGWCAVTLKKAWFDVADRASSSRTVAETWFAIGDMSEDEMVMTGLIELARAMRDDLS